MSIDLDGIRQGQRAMWSSGDYPDIARRIESAAQLVAERADAGPGVELLDVATGSGNVALLAARAGASVTGLDLTPSLLEVAAARAQEAGLEVRLIEGDAEALPFADGSFDRVTSCFGAIFAPRHERAAAELMRVARPGGRIVVTAWTPEGFNGRMFGLIGSYMPTPPPELRPSVLWGTEDHVRSLFEGAEVSCERHTVTLTHDSPEGWLEYNERVLGPTIMARAALEPQGRWEELSAELLALNREVNEAQDGSFRAQAEFLLSVTEMPA